MTYDAFASSLEGNRPVEIYRIVQGGSTWEFTSWESAVTISSLTYAPEAISRGRIGQTQGDSTSVLEVTVPSGNAFAKRFAASTPGSLASITIQRYQFGDGATPEVITIYEGKIASVSFEEDESVAQINCTPRTSAQSRPIPRFTYQNLCNHVLYDGGCKVDNSDARWRLSAVVSALVGNVITVTGAGAFGASWWAGGLVEIGGGTDSRLVLSQSGDDLQLLLPFPSSIVGQTVLVLAGCDHNIATCDTKFNTPEDPDSNAINYGGFAFVPTKNPYQVGL